MDVLGSQALETAIGLAVLFFIVATAASTVVEVISRVMGKRAKNLEDAVRSMFMAGAPGAKELEGADDDNPLKRAMSLFKATSVYNAAEAAAGKTLFSTLTGNKKRPSYLSAKAFADAVTELLVADADDGSPVLRPIEGLPDNLQKRVRSLVRETGDDLVALKSGLERWFDETMEHVEGAYKRWATLVLFAVGLVITIGGNVSTISVAQHLWRDPATRQAVVAAADNLDAQQDLGSVAKATGALQELRLPVGYGECPSEGSSDCFSWTRFDASIWTATIAGWLLTALLVMLGGPFWYDLLNRLVSLRSTGSKPALAPADPGSATSARLTANSRPAAVTPRQLLAQALRAAPPPQEGVELRLARALGATPPPDA